MPPVAGGLYYHGVAGDEGQAADIAEKVFAAAFEADFDDVKFFKVTGQVKVLKPVEYIEAGTAATTAAFRAAARSRSSGAASTGGAGCASHGLKNL